MKAKDATKWLETYDPEEEMCVLIWVGDDVRCVAKEKGMELTDEQVDEVVDTLHRRHDASIGVSWDVIDVNLDWIEFDDEEEEI